MSVTINGTTGIDTIQDGIVTTAKIAADAVTTPKIADTVNLGRRNLFINGKVSVNQRGNQTNAATSTVNGPDRFFLYKDANSYQVDVSQETDVPSGQGFEYSFQWKTSAVIGSSAADKYIGFGSNFEVQDVYPYLWGGQTHITASFWVKSSIAGTFGFNINPASTNSGGNADRILYHSTYTIDAVNTWEYKTITIPLSFLSSYGLKSGYSDNAKGLEVTWVLDLTSGGTRDDVSVGWSDPATEARNMVSSAPDTGFFDTLNATFKITGIQIERGDTATPFEHRSYGEELSLCQRYYWYLGIKNGIKQRFASHVASNYNTTDAYTAIINPVQMRTAPTITVTGSWVYYTNSTGKVPSSRIFQNIDQSGAQLKLVTSGLTAGAAGHIDTGGNEYAEFSAEL